VTTRLIALTTARGWLAGIGLVVDLKVLLAQVESTVGSAACFERAKWEMVLCGAPPEAWQVALAITLAVGLAMLFGSEWRLALERRGNG
jgi:hypothetical protein